MYDVLILGGGPAGAAAALSLKQLRPASRICVVEASAYQDWRAGETLSPACRQLLAGLGCWEAFQQENFLESFGTRAAWGSSSAYDNEFMFSAHGNGWHVDRRRFDSMLAAQAREAGAEILLQSRLVNSERIDDCWRLVIRQDEGLREFRAAFVVDATGRAASFAVAQGARRVIDDHLTGAFVVFHFSEDPSDTRTLVEAHEDGWWYSSLLPDKSVVVAWMSDADLVRERGLHRLEAWREHLSRSTITAARLKDGWAEGSPRVYSAQSQRLSRVAGDGWIAAGDAACTFDPLSSAGILKALRSGKMAGFVAFDFLEGRSSHQRYEAMVREEYRQYEAAKRWFYGLEQRWPHAPFWARRQQMSEKPLALIARMDGDGAAISR